MSSRVALHLLAACIGVPPLACLAESGSQPRAGAFQLSAEDRAYWAFQPLRRPEVPRGAGDSTDPLHPIDAFLAVKLDEKGLASNPPATPRELVRRVSFDLVGLPPTPEKVAAFASDPSDLAWVALIDRLLASPQYGERWGRHWLDLVRYAESNGYERDGEKPNAWRYRDYVIAAFNEDKPYDRFIKEQLAGDELAEGGLAGVAGSQAWRDAIIATGFYRLHVWDDEPDSTVAAEFDDLDDVMVTTGTAFLGLTIGCARCHDHKFDPISQRDYYALLAFFRSIDGYGLHKTGGGGRGTGKIQRPLAAPHDLARWEHSHAAAISGLESKLADAATDGERVMVEAELNIARSAVPPFDYALAVAENGPDPQPTRLLFRGDPFSPRDEVKPSFPAVLSLPAPQFPPRPAQATTTGRRSVLAAWITSSGNPLTARVLVNRVWQKHFGTGIVPTPDDFGRTGLPPTHPELLDYLAAEFVAHGWSHKWLHRFIMTSRAYRQSSRTDNHQAAAVDEANTLFWRQQMRRLEAECVRDMVLAVAGTLNTKSGGPSVYPTLPAEVHGTQDSAGKGWTDSPAEEQNRRSIYLVVKRALMIPLLESLDFANSASPVAVRPSTTTAPQALMWLNDSFVHQQSTAFARRLSREMGESEQKQITRGFQLALQREPAPWELTAARKFLQDQRDQTTHEKLPDPQAAAWTSFCRSLFNLNETIHVE